MDSELTRSQLVRWRAAVFAIFLASGLSIATWAARVPDIKQDIGVDNAQLGLMLLAGGIASILGVTASSVILARFGARKGMLGAMILFGSGLSFLGLGAQPPSPEWGLMLLLLGD